MSRSASVPASKSTTAMGHAYGAYDQLRCSGLPFADHEGSPVFFIDLIGSRLATTANAIWCMVAPWASFTLEQSRSLASLPIFFPGLGIITMVAHTLLSWRGPLVLAMVGSHWPMHSAFYRLSLP